MFLQVRLLVLTIIKATTIYTWAYMVLFSIVQYMEYSTVQYNIVLFMGDLKIFSIAHQNYF